MVRVYRDSLTSDIKAAVKAVTADMLHRLAASTTSTSSNGISSSGGTLEQDPPVTAASAAEVEPGDVDGEHCTQL